MAGQMQKARTSLRLVEAFVQLERDGAEDGLKRLAGRAAHVNLPPVGPVLVRPFEWSGLCAVDDRHNARRDERHKMGRGLHAVYLMR